MFNPSIPYNRLSAAFILKHSKEDPKSLILKYHGQDLGFDIDFAVMQIESRHKTFRKLYPFIKNPDFLFPSSISAEQASHSAVAHFHASLITSGTTLLDMTAGLGIDAMTMAGKASEVIAVEIDPLKCDVLTHNSEILGLRNMKIVRGDSIDWLNNCGMTFDAIFIDPARRDSANTRKYALHDCVPDVVSIQNFLKKRCGLLLIKGSPLLDITRTLLDMQDVRAIRAICVEGECKEVLIEIGNSDDTLLMEAVDLHEDGSIKSRFSYSSRRDGEEESHEIKYAAEEMLLPGIYLYEPNAAMMKLSPWRELQERYPCLLKLAPSSHLFISEKRLGDFPGRVLLVDEIVTGKDKKRLKGERLNVVARNYPVSATDLRKKLGLLEGKDRFLFATRVKNPIMLIAHR